MAETTKGLTAEELVRDVRAGKVAPVYYLMGEEEYYINELSEFLTNALLKPEERDFNLDIVYGADTDIIQVVELAQAYPMMADRRVVVVREAQALGSLDALEHYLQKPNSSTVLIFCHKHGMLDGRKSVLKSLQKVGVVYESKRPKEYQIAPFIVRYLKKRGLEIEQQAVQMLVLHVGADLCRLASEMDKLLLAISPGERMVTAVLVEKQTGVNREYNDFELQTALATRDIDRAARIVKYFQGNPRSFALQRVLSNLFTFFSDLMIAFYAPDHSDRGVAAWLEKKDWAVKRDILPALQNYTGVKTMLILDEIRKTDARSKGLEGVNIPAGELLQDLIFFILH
ncbi:MAG: DNA polymerase III subunit delta [Bacteroidaceae bacterium]